MAHGNAAQGHSIERPGRSGGTCGCERGTEGFLGCCVFPTGVSANPCGITSPLSGMRKLGL